MQGPVTRGSSTPSEGVTFMIRRATLPGFESKGTEYTTHANFGAVSGWLAGLRDKNCAGYRSLPQ